ncbi:MAG: hemolysin family protein [Chloroflexi bacterium]|nr:hemolysin family protein [Chloroflexota bacterium]
MDTDSLPPLLLILAGSLLLFTFLSIAEHTGSNSGGILRDSSPNQRAWFLISPFKYACIVATVLSGFFLIRLYFTQVWLDAAILFVASLVVLTLIHRLASAVAARHQGAVARVSTPLISVLRRSEGRIGSGSSSSGNGNQRADSDGSSDGESLNITEEELVGMDQHDREMLRSIIQLDNSTAHEVMVPRLDVVALEINTPIPQALEPIIRSGHTRIPVFEDNIDHIVGIIHSLDLLQLFSKDDWSQASLKDLVRQAYFIPETKRLDVLLEEFQQKAVQMAVVVDEYGGTEGIITLEDLLEEIVGEIEDEFSWGQEEEVVLEETGAAVVNASVTNDVIEEMFGVKLDNPDVDTIGGYVYMSLGRMPHVGDLVETDVLVIEITSILGRRIQKVRIQRKEGATLQ